MKVSAKRQKGGGFLEMAFHIDPALKPENIKLQDLSSAASLILKREALVLRSPAERRAGNQKLIRSRFLRFISAFLAKDTDSMLSMLDGSVYLTPLKREIPQAEMALMLEQFFASVSLSGLVLSQVYDFNSLKITETTSTPVSWGETYSIDIKTLIDFSEAIAFWEKNQRFLIHLSDGRWLIFAVGSGLPPASWTPQAAPAAGRKPLPVIALTGAGQEIKQAFLACFNSFLVKDIPRAAGFFCEEIQILRLNASLSRNEIAATFEGYAENRDFSQVRSEDVLAPESIFVEETEKFAGLKPSPAYLLNVKTNLDLSEMIPFWTRFQEYYFTLEDGEWKIFAIF